MSSVDGKGVLPLTDPDPKNSNDVGRNQGLSSTSSSRPPSLSGQEPTDGRAGRKRGLPSEEEGEAKKAKPSSFHVLNVRTGSSSTTGSTGLGDRKVIGCYSLDGQRTFHDDRRALKFYEPESAERVFKRGLSLKLSIGFENFQMLPESEFSEEGLQPILTWLERHSGDISSPEMSSHPKFVTNRSSLKMMLSTPCLDPKKDENYRYWGIKAEKKGDEIHLSQSHRRPTPESENLLTYQGYMFEKYLLSDEPGKEPDPNDKPVSQSEGFYCVFRAKVGGLHSILYSAEMDAMVATEDVKKIYQRDGSFDSLNLQGAKFVELKTSKSCYLFKDKMRTWWCQCSPVGVKTVVCGFKQGDEVRRVEEYSMENLHPDCQKFWRPDVCNDFLVRFLSKIRQLLDGVGSPQSVTFKLDKGSVYRSC